MSKRTRSFKNPSIKQKKGQGSLKKQTDKEILSLLTKSLSPNQIANHYKEISNVSVSSYRVRETLREYKIKIEKINKKFDSVACQSISLIEMDETFKGMSYKVLVVMDSITGYIFLITKILRKSEKCIKKALKPLKELLRNVKVVLTDGAVYFPAIIRDLCPNAVHQICLVHVIRSLNKYLKELKEPFADFLKIIKSLRKKLKNLDEMLSEKQYSCKKLKQQHKYHIKVRERLQKSLGVYPYMKGILDKYPKLREKNLEINALSGRVDSLEDTIESKCLEFNEVLESIKAETPQLNSLWNEYMQNCKIYQEFYSLFFHHQKEYAVKKNNFIQKIKKDTNNKLKKKMIKLLEKIPGLDAINRSDTMFPLRRQYQNTNGIESFNSRFHPLLESLKNIANSRLTQIRFNLFRLYINTTTPNNPSRSNCSPIECYGYDLRDRSTFDLIIDGLPSGPQSLKVLPEKIVELTSRKLIKKDKVCIRV